MNDNQERSVDTKAIKLFLIAAGLEASRNSYRNTEAEQCFGYYMNLNPKEMKELWSFLSENVKTEYIRKNLDKIFQYVSNKE